MAGSKGLDGDVAVRGRSALVDLEFDDAVENLDLTVMGVIEISRGRWSFMAGINYAESGADKSFGPISVDAEIIQFLGDFIVIHLSLWRKTISLDAHAGARVNSVGLKFDVNDIPTAGKDFSRSQGKTWTDPIIGGCFQADLSDRFFFRAVGDIDGFGIASDLTWEAMAGFSRQVMENPSLLAGYRGIGTDDQDGGIECDIIAHGPILGFECKF